MPPSTVLRQALLPAASCFIAGQLVRVWPRRYLRRLNAHCKTQCDLSVHACNRHIHLITFCQWAKKTASDSSGRGSFGTLARIYPAVMSCIAISNVEFVVRRSRKPNIKMAFYCPGESTTVTEGGIFLEGRGHVRRCSNSSKLAYEFHL